MTGRRYVNFHPATQLSWFIFNMVPSNTVFIFGVFLVHFKSGHITCIFVIFLVLFSCVACVHINPRWYAHVFIYYVFQGRLQCIGIACVNFTILFVNPSTSCFKKLNKIFSLFATAYRIDHGWKLIFIITPQSIKIEIVLQFLQFGFKT